MKLTQKSKRLVLSLTLLLGAVLPAASSSYASGGAVSSISTSTLSKYNLTLLEATKLIGSGTTSTGTTPGGSSLTSGDSTFATSATKCLPIPTPNYMLTSPVREVDGLSFTNTLPSKLVVQLSSSAYPSSGNGEAEAAKLPSVSTCLGGPIKALFTTPSEGITLTLSHFTGSVVRNPNLPKGAYALAYTGNLAAGTVTSSFEIIIVAAGHGDAVALYTIAMTKLGKSTPTSDFAKLENALFILVKNKVNKVGLLAS